MRALKSSPLFKHLALLFLIAYLFVAFSNTFFVVRSTCFNSKAFYVKGAACGSFVKFISVQKNNSLKFFDKSSFDTDRLNIPRSVAKCLIIIFIGYSLFSVKIRSISPQQKVFHNLQGSYLSFCTLRIWCRFQVWGLCKFTLILW